jgi:hypothetical protein
MTHITVILDAATEARIRPRNWIAASKILPSWR